MNAEMMWGLLHPAIAVVIVYPLIGMVVRYALQIRQRRLEMASGKKSKVPPVVGREHVAIGRWLAAWVVGITLLALGYIIVTKSFIHKHLWQEDQTQAIILIVLFVFTCAATWLLYQAKTKAWRATFVTLSSMGIILLGCQDVVFRRGFEWYWSHYYLGVASAILMLISLAILPEIYKDKTQAWRRLHIALSVFAFLLFVGQGITGARDLFEIGLYIDPNTL
ncbi:MAG: DUF4079 domain-containing protein [Spirulina sp. SIO3F2]|nr:DUF4079 domain-containing protein [Spirulina sp. SIO3F2]